MMIYESLNILLTNFDIDYSPKSVTNTRAERVGERDTVS